MKRVPPGATPVARRVTISPTDPAHMNKETTDEVEAPQRRGPVPEVALDPLDALRHVRSDRLSCRPGVFERRYGEVDCGDPPSGRGQPHCLGAVPASRIESEARLQVGGLGERVCVRWATRNLVRMLTQGLSPALLPGVAVERVVGHNTSLTSPQRTDRRRKTRPPESPT